MQDSNSDMAIQWTDNDKERLKRREVIIYQQNIMERDLKDSELPSDIHMVYYRQNNQNYSDAVRASKMSEIFDAYYDKLKLMGEGEVIKITNGHGSIKPKLYQQPEKNKG